jgi:hypothetical protein
LALAITLMGCNRAAPAPRAISQEEVADLQRELDATRQRAIAAELELEKAKAEAKALAEAAPAQPPGFTDEGEVGMSEAAAESAGDRCWHDYCPCKETGPIDRTICRNQSAGIEVLQEQYSIGAMARDMRLDD